MPSTLKKSTLSRPLPLLVEERLDELDFFGKIREEISQKMEMSQTILVVFESHSKLKLFRQFMQNCPIKHEEYRLPEELHDEITHRERDGVVSRAFGRCAVDSKFWAWH
jgi:hypothetical protein